MGALFGSVASGLMGMVGANAAQQNAEAMQSSAEAYNTQMADTQYQRGMADMKAAGLNPMLAYMQGGDSAPTAPTYTPSTPLDQLSDPLLKLGQAIDKLPVVAGEQSKATSDGRAALANANSAESQAQVQTAIAPLQIQKAVADTSLAKSNALVRAQTVQNNIAASAADVRTKQANADAAESEATSAGVQANIDTAGESAKVNTAGINPYVDTTGKIISGAASAVDAGAAVQAVRAFGRPKMGTVTQHYNSKGQSTGSTYSAPFDSQTGATP